MATMRVTIDGKVVMNGNIGQWTTEPPKIITDQLKPNAKPAPWMRALMLTLADAALSEHALTVDVKTRADGWDYSVTHGRDH
jgi:hypothetical protein